MTLDARLVVTRAAFTLDVTLRVAPGEVVALLGPNGAGKTTALRALAGLTAMSEGGRIVLRGRPLHPLPAESRPIGMVFQDYLLFPHLSVLDNVAFGPRCQGVSKVESRRLAAGLLERVGLADRAAARPRQLSGGQAQRVALARALAVRPELLLLDEPLAALDAHTRLEIRSQLRRHLADFDGATVLVTHDPLDAMVLADRLVVIEHGAVVQQGAPAEVARHPRTDYVARLVGLNLYRGVADGARVKVGELLLHTSEHLEGAAFAAFPPAAVALYRTRPDGSPRNLWQARIDGIERHGDNVRVHLDGPITVFADITPAALADLDLTPGQRIWASVKAAETHAYPA
ncbi:ABC transporter ATP-binding protein [Nonomuraea gerenzanensis]|uniref:ABC-type quaternary amine transporter n=1 Tax=Nonomuraea gerenzanensis TaxID=93944 RepID=A0A1M4EAL2_9ACTN|nr:ABC transporter ATP-binding protein [Nonomuraea gerenzanensis]UBU17990.1 ABC transporter ATP-binding protein [Nonomuraea gerenzanensis]SBO95794.1 Molybdenum transport ATP-binding protein ModC (TC 3.A.1.8.1) [Nonomuraea gerenzanensis]